MFFYHDFCVLADHLTLLYDAGKALQRLRSPKRLMNIIEALTLDLGFLHFAIIEHCDLHAGPPCFVCFRNYPPIWADQFVARRLYLHDPLLRACLTAGIGFECLVDLPFTLRESCCDGDHDPRRSN